ncbi:hypothetical protein ACLB2K_044650 [Fragaria x ananassa]
MCTGDKLIIKEGYKNFILQFHSQASVFFRGGCYWHHWQDVLIGSLIGIVIASICYLQSFPYPNKEEEHVHQWTRKLGWMKYWIENNIHGSRIGLG